MLKDLNYKFHLEETGKDKFLLYPVKENRFSVNAVADSNKKFNVPNEFKTQPLQFSAKLVGAKGSTVAGTTLRLDNNNPLVINIPISEGQYLIAERGKLFLADRNRKKLEEIKAITLPVLLAGTNTMQWELHSTSTADVKLDVVVCSIGNAQQIGN
jgi:hypothetical protein